MPPRAASSRKSICLPCLACVYVVEGDTAWLRLVTLGEPRDNRREILSGLTAGEKIIVMPPPLLFDGSRVAIQEAAK